MLKMAEWSFWMTDSMNPILIQAIGFVGVLFFIISYQIKSNRMLFLLQLLGTAMFCCQFLLLGATSGAANLIGIMVRNALLIKYRDWAWVRSKWTEIIFLIFFTAAFIATWQGLISLLPYAAVVSTTIAYWIDNAQKIRLGNLACGSPCWLIYDVLIGSWAGVLNESITLGSIIVSIWRYGWKAMGSSDSGF